jgi:hypothetical protein
MENELLSTKLDLVVARLQLIEAHIEALGVRPQKTVVEPQHLDRRSENSWVNAADDSREASQQPRGVLGFLLLGKLVGVPAAILTLTLGLYQLAEHPLDHAIKLSTLEKQHLEVADMQQRLGSLASGVNSASTPAQAREVADRMIPQIEASLKTLQTSNNPDQYLIPLAARYLWLYLLLVGGGIVTSAVGWLLSSFVSAFNALPSTRRRDGRPRISSRWNNISTGLSIVWSLYVLFVAVLPTLTYTKRVLGF